MIPANIRQSVRALLKKPGYAAISVLTLALGIAANAVIFSLVNAVLLKPLSYPNASRIVTLLHGGQSPVSPADFFDWRRESSSFADMQAANAWSATLSGSEGAEQIPALEMTTGMFQLLGVRAALGRTFLPEDGAPNRDKVIVLSHGLWKRRFGGDPAIVGQPIRLSGVKFTVVGVMPPNFAFAPFWVTNAEMWAPLVEKSAPTSRRFRMLRVFGLLRPRVEIRAAQVEVDAIAARLAQAYPDSNAAMTVAVEPLVEKVIGNVRTPLLLLSGAVGLVMLIACTNIASLTLARALERRREIGIRVALGAGRARIARQLLTESLLISSAGGIAGVGLSFWGLALVKILIAERLPRIEQAGIDLSVLGFTAFLVVLTGILFGLAPAIQAAGFDVNSSLKESSRGSSEGSGGVRLRGILVIAEIAICLVLLTGAGILLRSYLEMRSIDPGFDANNLITMNVSVTGREDYTGERRDAIYKRIRTAVEGLPGVQSASMVNHLPIGGDTWGTPVAAEGAAIARPGEGIEAVYRVADAGYFQTMKIEVVRGRAFNEFDLEGTPPVAIVNQTLANRLWPGQSAVGKRVNTADAQRPEWMTVAGVIRDVRNREWTPAPQSEIYFAYAQNNPARTATAPSRSYMTFVVRTAGDPHPLREPVRRTIAGIDREIAVSQLRSFDQIVGGALWQARFAMTVILVFAAFALLLACVGIYGVMSWVAASRAHETSIRMALGASRASVLAMVLKQGLALAGAGLVTGIVAALLLTRFLRGFVYGVSPADPLTFLAAPALLLLIALLSMLLPAMRASSTDPAQVLRS